jgi:hypothetical protein
MKTKTWLPLFNGYYDSIWGTDRDEENEIECINEQRKEKGLDPITWDDCKFNYGDHFNNLSKAISREISEWLIKEKYVNKYKFEKLSSPKQYNYNTDAIYIEYSLTKENKKNITKYLLNHRLKFEKYLKDRYTSYDGFFSSYSNNVNDWLDNDYFTHEHKLGAVLDFIIRNEDDLREIDIYEHLSGNGYNIHVSNYTELIGG